MVIATDPIPGRRLLTCLFTDLQELSLTRELCIVISNLLVAEHLE